MKRVMFAALALATATAAHGATLLDFGTDPGKVNNTTPGFSIWGGWGAMAVSRTFSADSVNLTYTASAGWTSKGEQYRGTLFNGIDLTGVGPDDRLALNARIILGTPAPDFYLYRVTLLAVDGSTSTYDFINSVRTNPTPFNYGTDAGSVPFGVVEATTAMGSPASVHATNGGFDFATDVFAGIDIYYQSGPVGGTVSDPSSFTMETSSLQIIPIPEPASLGLLGTAGLLLIRRRR